MEITIEEVDLERMSRETCIHIKAIERCFNPIVGDSQIEVLLKTRFGKTKTPEEIREIFNKSPNNSPIERAALRELSKFYRKKSPNK